MNKIITTLAVLAVLAVPALAQTPSPSPAAPAAPVKAGCTEEAKNALYTEFTASRTTDFTKAYEAGKKYLACSQTEDQYTAYLKKWVAAYEKELRKARLNDLFINQRKYPEAAALAKEILVDEPEYLVALMDLGYGGYVVAVTTKNEALNSEAIGFAKKAIQQIEAGKTPPPEAGKTVPSWLPFKSKDDALAYLNYSIGYLDRTNNTPEALKFFIKSAQYESEIKKNPQTYAFIAGAYESQYAKLSADYERDFKDKPETDASKLAAENINQVVDRIIDSLARAVALAGTNQTLAASKTQWLDRLTELYKFRHAGKEDGLNEMIAAVLSKPLPPVPTPLTTLPTTTPATTPTSGANPSSTSGNGAATSTATAQPGTTTTSAPKTTTSTAKPKPRKHHRRN
jgi:tetratricopeptide (TPR) repeat protein